MEAPGLVIEKHRLASIGNNLCLGIIGDANHSFGYHLASPPSGDYSRAGAANNPVGTYSCAIDISMNWPASRDWLRWLIEEIAEDRITGIAEVIGSYDGRNVRYWSDGSGWHTDGDPYGGTGHDTWTHVAIYRSTARDDHGILTGWESAGFAGEIDNSGEDDSMAEDYGPYGKPEVVGDRTVAVMIADLWAQNLMETSPYAADSPSANTARLQRVEEKVTEPAPAAASLNESDVAELARSLASQLAPRIADEVTKRMRNEPTPKSKP